MTATLRKAKGRLSEIVRLPSRSEEVVINVHDKETVKLVGVSRQKKQMRKEKWLKRLKRLREQNWTGRYGKTAQEIQDEDRAERF